MTLALVYYSASYGKLKIINENSSFISKLNNRLKQQFYGYLIEFSHLPCRAVSTPLTDGETETLRVTGPRTLVGVQQNQENLQCLTWACALTTCLRCLSACVAVDSWPVTVEVGFVALLHMLAK